MFINLPAILFDFGLIVRVMVLLLAMIMGPQLHASDMELADPTAASPALLERLRIQPKTQAGEEEVVSLPAIRLRAIVLRDMNHGTAIMGSQGKRLVVLRLRRGGKNAAPVRGLDRKGEV